MASGFGSGVKKEENQSRRMENNLEEFLFFLPEHEVLALAKTTTGSLLKPSSVKEAISLIIKYSDTVTVLNRQRVKKEYLASYLHSKNRVSKFANNTKTELCREVLELWNEDSKVDSKPLKFVDSDALQSAYSLNRSIPKVSRCETPSKLPLKSPKPLLTLTNNKPATSSSILEALGISQSKRVSTTLTPAPSTSSSSSSQPTSEVSNKQPSSTGDEILIKTSGNKENDVEIPCKPTPESANSSTCSDGNKKESSVSKCCCSDNNKEKPIVTALVPMSNFSRTENRPRRPKVTVAKAKKDIGHIAGNMKDFLELSHINECLEIRRNEKVVGHQICEQFSNWLFPRINTKCLEEGDFWPDCNMTVELTSKFSADFQRSKEILHSGRGCREEICFIRDNFNVFFHPNTLTGIRGKLNPHGLAQTITCGTVARSSGAFFGVFELVTGLMRDYVHSEGKFRIKFCVLRIREGVFSSLDPKELMDSSLSGVFDDFDAEEENITLEAVRERKKLPSSTSLYYLQPE